MGQLRVRHEPGFRQERRHLQPRLPRQMPQEQTRIRHPSLTRQSGKKCHGITSQTHKLVFSSSLYMNALLSTIHFRAQQELFLSQKKKIRIEKMALAACFKKGKKKTALMSRN